MPSKQYRQWRRKARNMLVKLKARGCRSTYNLVLNGHDTEVDNLHSWPDQPVGLKRRDIDVLELALHGTLSTALGYGHECEEAGKTW